MSGLFKSTVIKGNRITDFAQTSATVGVPIPKIYGRAPSDGNVIFAPLPPKENRTVKRQGKGGVKQESFTYTLSYAIAFCQGPIYGYWWIKRNGKVVWTSDPAAPIEDAAYAAKWAQKATFYYGTASQLPDSTIESYKGTGAVSAFRYLAYIVVEDDDVTDNGGAVPSYEAVPIATPPEIILTSHPYVQEIVDHLVMAYRPAGGSMKTVVYEGSTADAAALAYRPAGGRMFVYTPPQMHDAAAMGLAPTFGRLRTPPSAPVFDEAEMGFEPSGGALKNPPRGDVFDEAVMGFGPSGGELVGPPAAGSTFNPLDKSGNIALSFGDLTATATAAGWKCVRGTLAKTSGLWYAEFYINDNAGNDLMVGSDDGSGSLASYPGSGAGGYAYYSRGSFYHNSGSGSGYLTYTTGDVIGIAYNATTGKIWFSVNGAFSGDPVAGTGAAHSSVTTGQMLSMGCYPSGAAVTLRTESGAMSYSPPTGFAAWG